ncbi:MAG: glycerophosphodiester phosphodiesterase [Oscillospiraceae bacterium]|nr:glycerophosphodiester phosphodiesterase [Oscillospiraceae bacterium]
MLYFLIVLLVLYILAVRCRSGHPDLKKLQGWAYAHRGLHGNGLPENSMAAFRAALEGGCGIELDVHLLKDGNLAVIHDSLLKRTTGAEGKIEDLTTTDLQNYRLEGTAETIPTFRQVLDLYAGKAPLIVELKPIGGNHAALAETACKMLDSYKGVYCIESFDPRCVYWLKKNRPDIIRGQLSENFLKTGQTMPLWLRFALTHNLLNFLTVPDFIAYKFEHRNQTPSNALCRKLWKAQGVSWTLRSKADYDTAVKEGWLPIFEKFIP